MALDHRRGDARIPRAHADVLQQRLFRLRVAVVVHEPEAEIVARLPFELHARGFRVDLAEMVVGEAVVRVARIARGVDHVGRQAAQQRARERSADGGGTGGRVVAAVARAHEPFELLGRPGGQEVDRTASCCCAHKAFPGAAQHLDALDVVDREIEHVRRRLEHFVDVDPDRRVDGAGEIVDADPAQVEADGGETVRHFASRPGVCSARSLVRARAAPGDPAPRTPSRSSRGSAGSSRRVAVTTISSRPTSCASNPGRHGHRYHGQTRYEFAFHDSHSRWPPASNWIAAERQSGSRISMEPMGCTSNAHVGGTTVVESRCSTIAGPAIVSPTGKRLRS